MAVFQQALSDANYDRRLILPTCHRTKVRDFMRGRIEAEGRVIPLGRPAVSTYPELPRLRHQPEAHKGWSEASSTNIAEDFQVSHQWEKAPGKWEA